ncbi:hypothetical protein DPSP01_000712 [Paraphaeosphaeria sporulosa]
MRTNESEEELCIDMAEVAVLWGARVQTPIGPFSRLSSRRVFEVPRKEIGRFCNDHYFLLRKSAPGTFLAALKTEHPDSPSGDLLHCDSSLLAGVNAATVSLDYRCCERSHAQNGKLALTYAAQIVASMSERAPTRRHLN